MRQTWTKIFSATGVGALAASLIISGLAASSSKPAPDKKTEAAAPQELKLPVMASFAPIVKKVGPSVVQVDVTTKSKPASFQGLDPSNPFFRGFGGPGFPGQRGRQEPAQHGAGSGVIVTRDGYLITNNHVVEGADEVKVILQDRREFTAKVIGTDPKTDVAVLKIDAQDLPAAELADSDAIEVGDVVLAIGNPFGIGQTVTTGIVSAKGRATMGLAYEDFIQTDAAINPGNSGGALVDAQGRLVGINTAILSRSGGNQGIGFAIPVKLANSVMDSLVRDGRVTRSYIGVMIQDLTPALARQFDLKENAGALVGEVKPNDPADKAGIKSGDVLVEFDGQTVKDGRHLRMQVAQGKPGSTVNVKVMRDGKARTLKLTLKELPGDKQLASKSRNDADHQEALVGVAVNDLDAATRQQFGIPADVKGVMVAEVEPGSPAYEAGLRPGSVIQEINRQPVKTAEDATRLTENVKDKTTLLRVWNKGGSRYVVVDESKAG